MERPRALSPVPPIGRAARRARQQAIRDLVADGQIGSQQQLAERLAERGFEATQATVSRDIAELGLVKVVRGDRHVYAAAASLTALPRGDDSMLRRVLGDVPVDVRRSGLILLLVSTPGTASIVAEAIDRSSLSDQVGTIAGDNTVLVLFADEPALERWRDRLLDLQAKAGGQP
ncbi:MAG TPA: arginine repressor [Candidatus Dormibacteraeota bacterium]|nr:arginine repressor [Candidatus Dormibacteraeota bacterium]